MYDPQPTTEASDARVSSQATPPPLTMGKVCDGSVWWSNQAPYEARYIENPESPLLFSPDDERQICQYSYLTLIHDPGEQWLLIPFSVLVFLKAVDPAEADAFSMLVVQNFDGVAIEDADDLSH
jgi:hypothetical protein